MLEGVKIIEVEGLGPGPFASMLLADLGADVIVVHREKPQVGSERSILDRGKRSIVLDLKNTEDVSVFKKLVASADGLIEGFRPGVMERLGVGPDDCHKVNPKLVFGRMTGWGQDGPLSTCAGHDLNYASLSGAAYYSSLPGDAPFTPPTMVGDIGGGSLYLVIGMLAAIMNARESGEGTVVDAAIVDGSAHMMNLLMALRQSGGLSMKRGNSLLDGPHWSRTYKTSDGGYMSVQCLEPQFYAIFLEKLGLTDDADLKHQHKKDLWPILADRLSAVFAEKTKAEWTEIFEGTDACVAPVLNPVEAMAHPINGARNMWLDVDGVMQAAPAPRFSTQGQWEPKTSPKRDEDREEILKELNSA